MRKNILGEVVCLILSKAMKMVGIMRVYDLESSIKMQILNRFRNIIMERFIKNLQMIIFLC